MKSNALNALNTKALAWLGLIGGTIAIFGPHVAAHTWPTPQDFTVFGALLSAYQGKPQSVAAQQASPFSANGQQKG